MSIKETILSKSNSYNFYKDFYEKNQKKLKKFNFYKKYYQKNKKESKNVVNWDFIFNRVSKDKEIFDVTVEGLYENYQNGNTGMKYCPVCKHKTPLFIAGGVNYRKNAMCPNCNSLERHRFLSFFLDNHINFTEDFRLLHFAPEKSFYDIFENMDNVDYYTCDIEKSYYVKEVMDIQNIHYDDNYFNLIICNHVLEHVQEDKKAMEELYRVIKPASENGGAIVMVPLDFNRSETLEKEEYNTPELREKYYHQHDHVRLYGMDFQSKLEDVGFNIEVFDYNSPFIKNPAKYGIKDNGDMIFYCTKD